VQQIISASLFCGYSAMSNSQSARFGVPSCTEQLCIVSWLCFRVQTVRCATASSQCSQRRASLCSMFRQRVDRLWSASLLLLTTRTPDMW